MPKKSDLGFRAAPGAVPVALQETQPPTQHRQAGEEGAHSPRGTKHQARWDQRGPATPRRKDERVESLPRVSY